MLPQVLVLALLGLLPAEAGRSVEDVTRNPSASSFGPRLDAPSGRRTTKGSTSSPKSTKPTTKKPKTSSPSSSSSSSKSPPPSTAPKTAPKTTPPSPSTGRSTPASGAPDRTGSAGTAPSGARSGPEIQQPAAERPVPNGASRAPASSRPGVTGPTAARSSAPPPASARTPDKVAYDVGNRPAGGTRPYVGSPASRTPPHRTADHRYARPHHAHVHTHPHAHYRVPVHVHYRPWYTRWYVHPYYRWTYSTTVVVSFGFVTMAWVDTWAPPPRYGWTWVPGYWAWGYWHPGYWVPVAPIPVGYVYVPGWWEYEEVYVEGYYRVAERGDWEWVDGYYLDDGTYVRGHWVPADPGPEGYVWEAGFYDGEVWVDGFWRPEFRSGYTWVSSYYDDAGIYHGGYWMPVEEQPGYVWVPGWFDGNEWVEGYWVREEDYENVDLDAWEPPEGWDDGWEVGDGFGYGEVIDNRSPREGEGRAPGGQAEDLPLALPVVPPESVED